MSHMASDLAGFIGLGEVAGSFEHMNKPPCSKGCEQYSDYKMRNISFFRMTLPHGGSYVLIRNESDAFS
jgi:hypothetical protein